MREGGGIKGTDTHNPQDPAGNDTVRGKGQGKSKDQTKARGGGERHFAVEGCGGGGHTSDHIRTILGAQGLRGIRARVKAPPAELAPPRPGSHPTVKAPPPMGLVPREEPAAEPGVVVPPPAPPGVADPPRRRT